MHFKRSRETWSPVDAGAKVTPKKNILWPADGCCKKTLKNTMFSSVFAKRHCNDKQESRVSRKCHRDPPKKVNKTISLFKQKLNQFPVSLYYSVTHFISLYDSDYQAVDCHTSPTRCIG